MPDSKSRQIYKVYVFNRQNALVDLCWHAREGWILILPKEAVQRVPVLRIGEAVSKEQSAVVALQLDCQKEYIERYVQEIAICTAR